MEKVSKTELAVVEQVKAWLDEFGHEMVSAVPMAPPVGFIQQPSIMENVRAMVRSELLRHAAEAEGFESFEEADDFSVEDDAVDPHTPYEAVFDPVLPQAAPVVNAPLATAPVEPATVSTAAAKPSGDPAVAVPGSPSTIT